VFPSPHCLPEHLELIDLLLLHVPSMILQMLGASQQPASEIHTSGRVRSTLNRLIFTTACLLPLSAWFGSQGWQFPREKHKLQVVISTHGQWGHAALLLKGRNPEGKYEAEDLQITFVLWNTTMA